LGGKGKSKKKEVRNYPKKRRNPPGEKLSGEGGNSDSAAAFKWGGESNQAREEDRIIRRAEIRLGKKTRAGQP